jgi:diacylglycerol kinase (ATP)
MKPKNWIQSANLAIEGIIYAVKTQRHMRYHLFAAVSVLILSLIVSVSRLEFIALALAIVIVLVAEMLNTAIEITVDMIAETYHPLAKIAKDIAAGVVLLASTGALTLAYLILYPALGRAIQRGIWRIPKAQSDVVAFVALVVVVISVIIIKALLGRGEPLRGGMPSGHAAVAFSIWTASVYLTKSPVVSIMILVLAVLVSRSRWSTGIHRPIEVAVGALLGAGITALFFWIFS